MDEKKNPRAREKKVVSEGKGVEKKGEGLGTGPLNNTGSYEERKQQNAAGFPFGGSASRPGQGGSFSQQRPQQGQGSSGSPFVQGSHPQQGGQGLFSQSSRPQTDSDPFVQSSRPQSGSANPFGQSSQQQGSSSSFSQGGAQRQYKSAVKKNGTGGTQRSSGSGSGMGGGKILLIIIALVVLFGGGKLGGLFGGEEGTGVESVLNTVTQQTQTSTGTSQSSSMSGLTNLLSAFMGSSESSVYDVTGGTSDILSALTGSGSGYGTVNSSSQYFTSSSDSNTANLDETVAGEAREKFTRIIGNNKDEVTILVYMCGTDLESQQGMATSDLKEMANATIG